MSESVDEEMGNTNLLNNSSTPLPHSPRTHPLTNSSTHLPNKTPIIQVKHLSKRYQIGMDRTYKTFCESFTDTIKSPLKRLKSFSRQEEVFWALKDINFEVFPGEVVGIIGRNGAGKTTLLKILSRITHPTEGEIILRGRVASLLEVGTGFHPELTGRENVYFNGAILGMTKQEIEDKFDEIVEFSGVADFLDTPLKRYSSGMQVRLAFSVAAHLEPEILVVDEVLAVGDVSFQKKCLNKMQDVATGGRTVLFVSHNMGQISKLCQRAIMLESGSIKRNGDAKAVVDEYIQSSITSVTHKKNELGNILESEVVVLKSFSIYGDKINTHPKTGKPLNIELVFEFKVPVINPAVRVFIRTLEGVELMYLTSTPLGGIVLDKGEGIIRFRLTIEDLMLTGGHYILTVGMNRSSMDDYLRPSEICQFEVLPADYYSVGIQLLKTKVGVMAAKHKWSFEKTY